MMSDGLLGLCGIAGHQGVEDVLVFGADLLPSTTRSGQCRDSHQDLADVEFAVAAGEQLIVDGVNELLMKQGVQSNELPGGIGSQVVGHGCLEIKGLLHGVQGDCVLGYDELGGVTFQNAANVHELGNLAPGHHRYVRTALGNQFHKSIRNQEQESLTNWGSGYADLGCEFLLIEELPLHFRINQDVFA